jgi:Domain of unknown function (DUF4129)
MRRLVPLGLAVTVLVALAGIASHGRPLAGGRGRGPTATFFDYVATTLVLFAVAMLALLVYTLFDQRVSGGPPRRGRWHLVSAFISFAGALLLSYTLLHSHFVQRLRKFEQELARRPPSGQTQPGALKKPRNARNPHLRWDEIAVFIVLIGGATVVLVASSKTKGAPRRWSVSRRREVSLAIDESLDDLRADPDLRRAIVAAYARMESALGRAGMPRHPAEAPFEYVERALRSLETSADSVHRLTALFEWAKFSQHEPEPKMRDEAVDALVAVRDELARPVEEPVTA